MKAEIKKNSKGIKLEKMVLREISGGVSTSTNYNQFHAVIPLPPPYIPKT